MSNQEKIVPITSGRGKPDCASFAVMVGRTRVDIGIKPAQPVRRPQPATVVPLVRPQRRTGVTSYGRVSKHPEESK